MAAIDASQVASAGNRDFNGKPHGVYGAAEAARSQVLYKQSSYTVFSG